MLTRLLLVMMALMLIVNIGSAEPLSRIEADQSVFDFGEVLQGRPVEHTFVFRNVGDTMLVVDRVKSTCGCTGVLLSEKNIPPGGEGTIKAKFNSTKFQGRVEKRILLYSNDPSGKPIDFTLKGVVKLPLETNPNRISFGEVTVGQPKTVAVELRNMSGQPIKLVNLRTSNTAFRAEVDSTVLDSAAVTTLRVIAEPGITTTHLGGEILIRVDLPGLGEIQVPVSGSVVAAFPAEK